MVKSRVGAYSSSNKGSGAGASFVGTSSSSIQHAGSLTTLALTLEDCYSLGRWPEGELVRLGGRSYSSLVALCLSYHLWTSNCSGSLNSQLKILPVKR